ncbi:MAG: aldehyde dehydrogenase family protein [Salibacteraceae bacterium]
MSRVSVQKTYKLFIGGKFPRTESGRYYPLYDKDQKLIANMCLASRKDFRNAVTAARKSLPSWRGLTAYNRGQILYRLAEMLESRRHSFGTELSKFGFSAKRADGEIDSTIQRLVYYAGWCDKYTALFSSVNPVAASYFNFSVHEPTGVVAALLPEDSPLLGVVSVLAPALCGANSVVMLASNRYAPIAITFSEVIQNSDVPAGVVNIITGSAEELAPHFASHMDVNALVNARASLAEDCMVSITNNVKRYVSWIDGWNCEDPYAILALQELKTTWHPVQAGSAAHGGY